VNPVLNPFDKGLEEAVRRPRGIDAMRRARLYAVRCSVRERLEELKHQVVEEPNVSLSRTVVVENLPSTTQPIPVLAFASAETLAFATVDIWSFVIVPDLLLAERRALRRLLRTLNKIIAIALRRAASADHRPIVVRQRAFFLTHGNHPPRLSVRHRVLPGACAA
jgi:hypothetical protein